MNMNNYNNLIKTKILVIPPLTFSGHLGAKDKVQYVHVNVCLGFSTWTKG